MKQGTQAVQIFQKSYPTVINLLDWVSNFKIKESWNEISNADLNIQTLP